MLAVNLGRRYLLNYSIECGNERYLLSNEVWNAKTLLPNPSTYVPHHKLYHFHTLTYIQLQNVDLNSYCRPNRVRNGVLPISSPSLSNFILLILLSVNELRPDDTPENNFWYTFKVQCTSCREVHPNWINVSRFVSITNSVWFVT